MFLLNRVFMQTWTMASLQLRTICLSWQCFCAVEFCDKKLKVVHTQLPSVGFRSWSWFLAVSLQVTWVIIPVVGYHYFPPSLQLPPQPLRGLLPILLLGEQRHNGYEQFALDCYPTSSRLRFEPRPFCIWVQHADHSATEPPYSVTMFMFCRILWHVFFRCMWYYCCVCWCFAVSFWHVFILRVALFVSLEISK